MGYKLFIAEKYKNAVPFAKHLGASERHVSNNKGNIGYLLGSGWIVTWAAGHLITQAMPDEYDDRYKKWVLDDLPIVPTKWKTNISTHEPAKSQYRAIKKIFDEYQIDEIYNACDNDREGELIARELIARLDKTSIPMFRVWYNNTTDASIKKAMSPENLKPAIEYQGFYEAGALRQRVDWIYGLNMTRAYTAWSHEVQNIGRVVSPTINLLVERQAEIDSFVPQDYIVITANTAIDGAGPLDLKRRFDDLDAARSVWKQLKGSRVEITSVETAHRSERLKLFTLTELQAAASKLFGFDADATSRIAQSLYDKGFMSYPRTNANTINPEQVEETKPILAAAAKAFGLDMARLDVMRLVRREDDTVSEASHTGLTPTDVGIASLPKLDANESKVLSLVTIQMLSAAMPTREWDATKVVGNILSLDWTANGRAETESGYKPFYDEQIAKIRTTRSRGKKTDDAEAIPPGLTVGDTGTVKDCAFEKKTTKPPEQYAPHDLLETMEKIWSRIQDKELRDIMRKNGAGLGTQSSRDTVLATIQKSGFAVKEKGKLIPTEKAKKLMSLLPDELKSPMMTARLELDMSLVAQGGKEAKGVYESFVKLVRDEVDKVRGYEPIPYERPKPTGTMIGRGLCPKCGGDIVDTGKIYACSKQCGWKQWKTIGSNKKTLPQKTMKQILKDGVSKEKMEGLKGKSGKEFSCWLVLDQDNGVRFDFSDERPKPSAKKEASS